MMPSATVCVEYGCAGLQARKQAEAIEIGMRMDRLAQQAGESMVTTNTLASMDEDDDSALKRFNLILKVGPTPCHSCHHPHRVALCQQPWACMLMRTFLMTSLHIWSPIWFVCICAVCVLHQHMVGIAVQPEALVGAVILFLQT